MKQNVGTVDRVIRIFAGLLPLATGLLGWCALYIPLGIDTCHTGHDTPGAARPST